MPQFKEILFLTSSQVRTSDGDVIAQGEVIRRVQTDPVGVMRYEGKAFKMTPEEFRKLTLKREDE